MWQATLRTVAEDILGVKTHGKLPVNTGASSGPSLFLQHLTTWHNRKQLKKRLKLHWPGHVRPSPPLSSTPLLMWHSREERQERCWEGYGNMAMTYHGSKWEEGDQPWLGYEIELGLRLGVLRTKGHLCLFLGDTRAMTLSSWKWLGSHGKQVTKIRSS